MKKTTADILKKIEIAARRDAKRRKDPRYLKTMGFLVAKGFLETNQQIGLCPNAKITIDEAVWAGKNVEPRILEVLPAAIGRLAEHFILPAQTDTLLFELIAALIKNKTPTIQEYWGIPAEKFKIWFELPLRDGRTKTPAEKKVPRTYRFHQDVLEKLKFLAEKGGKTETEILENFVRNNV